MFLLLLGAGRWGQDKSVVFKWAYTPTSYQGKAEGKKLTDFQTITMLLNEDDRQTAR